MKQFTDCLNFCDKKNQVHNLRAFINVASSCECYKLTGSGNEIHKYKDNG